MQITERVTINAPAARLWEILVTDYSRMGEWSSAVTHSHTNLELPEGEEGRVCHTAVGAVAETVIHRDEQTYTFAYRTEKPPFFIRNATNHYRILPTESDKSVVEVQGEVTMIPVLAWLFYPLLKTYLNTLVTNFVEELKYYAEVGQIHPRKAKATAKGASTSSTPDYRPQP